MLAVWGADLPANEQWVLMAMADHADHLGRNVRPGGRLLAAKTGYDIRSIKRIQKALLERGIIERVRRTTGGTIEYQIRLDRIPHTETYRTVMAEYEAREDLLAARAQGDKLSPSKVTPVTPAKVTSCHLSGDKMSPSKGTFEPTKVTSQVRVRKEPSEENQREKEAEREIVLENPEGNGNGNGDFDPGTVDESEKLPLFAVATDWMTGSTNDRTWTDAERATNFSAHMRKFCEARAGGDFEAELRLLSICASIWPAMRASA